MKEKDFNPLLSDPKSASDGPLSLACHTLNPDTVPDLVLRSTLCRRRTDPKLPDTDTTYTLP
jgi:hypothetical protein